MKDLNSQCVLHVKEQGLEYLQFKRINDLGLVKHCITTRNYIKDNELNSNFDLNFGSEEKRTEALRRYKLAAEQMGFSSNIAYLKQMHGNEVEIVGGENTKFPKNADALITKMRGLTLLTNHADCMPLLLIDPVNKVIANVHSGWRSTVKSIGIKTVNRMNEVFNCNRNDILAVIGPSIGQCCFETDSDVLEEFEKTGQNLDDCYIMKGDKYHIDLWSVLQKQLIDAGIKPENIDIAKICTACNNDVFFSYRGDKQTSGRIAAIIQLI